MKHPLEVQLTLFPETVEPRVVNVASVPKRSPFRYPGGKTWLVPTARKWFMQGDEQSVLFEPFAGGGIVSLTAVAEHYFNHAVMSELDEEMAAAWQTIFSKDDCAWLVDRIKRFNVTPENVNEAVANSSLGVKEKAFATIVRNRTNHGGILAKGSGLIKNGEGGRGLSSRWYPDTLVRRITEANALRNRITFIHGDAFQLMRQHLHDGNAFFFIDPPYTVAGRRLYNLFDVDHHLIFELVSQMRGHFLLTYDDCDEVRCWAEAFHLPYRTIPMQTTHLIQKEELLISDNFEWMDEIARTQQTHFERAEIAIA